MTGELERMVGRTFRSVTHTGDWDGDRLTFVADDKPSVTFGHGQECCEDVHIHEIVGDLSDLEGSPLLQAECVVQDGKDEDDGDRAVQWTFYKFATIKGSVTVSWYGESNGWYSVDVDVWEE